MKFFILSAVCCIGFSASAMTLTAPSDSIGMEKVDGQVYVLHQVEQKETLYSLSKRYGASISSIALANPGAENGLSIGQILRIPYAGSNPEKGDYKIHVVRPEETLYSIARAYEVNVEDIKKWNNMSMNLLDIGQKLKIYENTRDEALPDIPERNTTEEVDVTRHTVRAGETLYSLSRKYGTSLEDLRAWNSLDYNDISAGQELIVQKTKRKVEPAPVVVPPTTGTASAPGEPEPADIAQENRENETQAVASVDSVEETQSTQVTYNLEVNEPLDRENTNYEEVEEDGLAELIDGSGNNRKYLALHRTAAMGTIMRVRNEMNGQEVFVRIIGRLPDTGTNRNVLIKISKAAYEQLGAIDNRFRVRISYIP